MFTTAVIAFREFLEAFLIVGVFLGISKKLNLKIEKEIGFATATGLLLSLLLNIGVYAVGDHTRKFLTEKNADSIESYLMIFSGFFIAYVVFSLHKRMNPNRKEKLSQTNERLKTSVFDISLFLTIVFLVVREGFEIAFFTASISLFSVFMQNFLGLLIGFASASVIGILTFFAYIKFPIKWLFKATEVMIVLLGASLVQTGITKFLETHFNIYLSNMLSFHFQFLPNEDNFVGNLLQGFLGIDQGYSAARLIISMSYITAIYMLFYIQKKIKHVWIEK